MDSLPIPLLLAVENRVLILGPHLRLRRHLGFPSLEDLERLALFGERLVDGCNDGVDSPQTVSLASLLKLRQPPGDLPVDASAATIRRERAMWWQRDSTVPEKTAVQDVCYPEWAEHAASRVGESRRSKLDPEQRPTRTSPCTREGRCYVEGRDGDWKNQLASAAQCWMDRRSREAPTAANWGVGRISLSGTGWRRCRIHSERSRLDIRERYLSYLDRDSGDNRQQHRADDRQVTMSYYFAIIGTQDNPIFEYEFGTSKQGGDGQPRFAEQARQMNQFILHSSLDVAEEVQWNNGQL